VTVSRGEQVFLEVGLAIRDEALAEVLVTHRTPSLCSLRQQQASRTCAQNDDLGFHAGQRPMTSSAHFPRRFTREK
jgi:hypothetical protein